ncbi:MAG: hypothetical protein AAB588_04500 [Patescibacteria group bacterium]
MNQQTRNFLIAVGVILVGVVAIFAIYSGKNNTGSGKPINIPVGTAKVDTVEVTLSESTPLQVRAILKGNFPDSCTQVGKVQQTYGGKLFTVTVTTERPSGAYCNQVLTPFAENIQLEAHGLSKGTYQVDVNGAKATFTLEKDNK